MLVFPKNIPKVKVILIFRSMVLKVSKGPTKKKV